MSPAFDFSPQITISFRCIFFFLSSFFRFLIHLFFPVSIIVFIYIFLLSICIFLFPWPLWRVCCLPFKRSPLLTISYRFIFYIIYFSIFFFLRSPFSFHNRLPLPVALPFIISVVTGFDCSPLLMISFLFIFFYIFYFSFTRSPFSFHTIVFRFCSSAFSCFLAVYGVCCLLFDPSPLFTISHRFIFFHQLFFSPYRRSPFSFHNHVKVLFVCLSLFPCRAVYNFFF